MTAPQLIIYENEDEDELLNEFIRLSALYPEYPPYEVASTVFAGKVEAWSRSMQAAQVWSNSIEIRERIRLAKANRNNPNGNTYTNKEEYLKAVHSLTFDDSIGYQEKKVRLDGMKLLGEANGWIIKTVDKKTENVNRKLPNFIIKKYDDEPVRT